MRELIVPMTKGCLVALGSAGFEAAEAGEEDDAGGDERRPSSRSPEKWGPDAASIT